MKKVLTQHQECDVQSTMSVGQLEKFARFLEIHPGFYPELKEENGAISGFRVGGCLLSIGEMDEFMSAEPHLAPHEASLLLTARPTRSHERPDHRPAEK